MVNKQTLHAGVVVAGPDGDVLVTYRGDQIQNTSDVLDLVTPGECTFPHKTCWCLDTPCCHIDQSEQTSLSEKKIWGRIRK